MGRVIVKLFDDHTDWEDSIGGELKTNGYISRLRSSGTDGRISMADVGHANHGHSTTCWTDYFVDYFIHHGAL
jgi:hypothetical protein